MAQKVAYMNEITKKSGGVIWIGTRAVEWPERRRCVMWNEVECGP